MMMINDDQQMIKHPSLFIRKEKKGQVKAPNHEKTGVFGDCGDHPHGMHGSMMAQ
jgi:hypothetical protein